MSLLSRTLKKIARRFRKKGSAWASFTGTKHTAQSLWESTHSFSNPKPPRAGEKRAKARLAAKLKRNAA